MVACRVREIRLERSLTQEQLARASEVSLRSIQRIEHQQHAPQQRIAARIAAALDVPVTDLYVAPVGSGA